MKNRGNIQSFTAAFLLLVMLLAIMPKQWLHYWLAQHTDIPASVAIPKNGPVIHAVGYSCDVNNMVVVLPFMGEQINVIITLPISFINATTILSENIFSSGHHTFATRGPPSAVNNFIWL